MNRYKMKRKAQVWFTDFIVGLFIFILVVYIYYDYAHNLNQDPTLVTSDLLMDAKSISTSLITQGSPADWNSSNVDIIGLTDGNQRIVQQKLDTFGDMDYQFSRTKLRTAYDYYLYLEDMDGNRIEIDGADGIGLNATDPDNLASITRIVIHDSELVRMVVKVWD